MNKKDNRLSYILLLFIVVFAMTQHRISTLEARVQQLESELKSESKEQEIEILEKYYYDSLGIREQLQGVSIDADTFQFVGERQINESYDFGMDKIDEIVETENNYYFKFYGWYDKVFVLPKDSFLIEYASGNKDLHTEAEKLKVGDYAFIKAFTTEKYKNDRIYGITYLKKLE